MDNRLVWKEIMFKTVDNSNYVKITLTEIKHLHMLTPRVLPHLVSSEIMVVSLERKDTLAMTRSSKSS